MAGGGAWIGPTFALLYRQQFSLLSGQTEAWGLFLGFDIGLEYVASSGLNAGGGHITPMFSFRYRVGRPADIGVRAGLRINYVHSTREGALSNDLYIASEAGVDVTFWIGGAPRLVLAFDGIFGATSSGPLTGALGYFGVSF
jgi:hypothetical protein